MLHIIRSNLVEALVAGLAERLSAAPLSSPFLPELVLVPSPAMARWINLQLAQRHGVAANVRYPLPASFVWQLAHALFADLPDADPLAPEGLAWRVFAALPERLAEPTFAPLARYLAGDRDGLKRWQLACRVAEVFDRYPLHRPEQIRAWTAGQGEDWQARLWRALVADCRSSHRVAVIDRLLAHLGGPGPIAGLPERLSLFAISSLPPLLVEVLQALAAHTTVDLYLHTPTNAFWADLIPQKLLARKRLERPDEADLWEVGNPLLASWGRQGQALHDLLLEREMPVVEIDACVEPPATTLLGRLQRDIFALRTLAADGTREAIPVDDTLEVHIGHSPLRECQILHDRLLAMLEREPDLRPEDILVMIPEISAYAPYVEAVFGQDKARDGEGGRAPIPPVIPPIIPWNLSDISVADEHPLVQVFLQLLRLPESRFSQSEVLSYLDVPELAGHFGLDDEAVSQAKAWLAEANLRWGLDGDHKARLGLPPCEENTWAQVERRLFGGYALGDGELFDGIAPIGRIEGTRAEMLGRLWRLFATLTEAAERLAAPRPAAEWLHDLARLLVDFFGERDDEDGRLQKIRDAIADLAEQAGGLAEPVSLALVRHWLAGRLEAAGQRGRYFSGGVTFCGMRPMRSLPFAVIAVLGLQDQAFPRRDRLAELDLLRHGWRPGDPRKGDEDRYLFLETLLCARRRLYLSYVGRDIRDNTERQPSVLLRELLDYIDQRYRPLPDPRHDGGDTAGDDGERLSTRLTHVHPLQPFSARRFVGPVASYDAYWCEVARALRQPATAASHGDAAALGWPDVRLPEAPERLREVGLGQLERFLRDPIRFFVNGRLQVHLGEEAPPEDDERFGLDRLQGYLLKQRLVAERLRGGAPAERLRAEGLLPHGAFAAPALAEETEALAPLLARLDPYLAVAPTTLALEIELDDMGDGLPGPRRLTGQLKGLHPGLGLLRWRPGNLRGADVLGLWLAHLAWCAAAPEPDGSAPRSSTLIALDEVFVLRTAVAPAAARAVLADALRWYWEGLHRPLLLLPRASFAYARAWHQGRRADPLKAARQAWDGNSFQGIPGDGQDPYVQLVLRGIAGDPLAHPDFARLAKAFYGPPLAAGADQ